MYIMGFMYSGYIILTITISASNSVRSQCSKCLYSLKAQESCDKCSSPHFDKATKEIQNAFSTVRDCVLATPSCYPANYDPTNMEEFDYIVVGAGTGGSVVANRLTEIPGWSILLLEAGGNPTMTSEVPALFTSLQKTHLDWQYKSDPNEDNCLGMNDNMCNVPRGKVLGGSSTINYMLYTRGNEKDYDGWAAEGNTGWGYEDVLPYFKKLEDMRDKKVQESSDFNIYHNKGGPQTVEAWPNKEVEPVARSFADGMNELGYPVNYDINGPSQAGYVVLQGTLKSGKRCSTAKAYLTPPRRRKNLKVSKYSLVTKVLVNNNKTAYGVQFLNKLGQSVTVRARKEVILSAGAINSPQLLMLSGIGPRENLQKFNISVVQDLPVGLNLQDHPAMSGLVITLDFDMPENTESILDFIMKNDSMYSSIGLGSYVSMINISSSGEEEYPDIELITNGFAKNDEAKLAQFLDIINMREENKKDYSDKNKNSYMIIVWICLLTPLSRGRIKLRSNYPLEYPKIFTGYYSNQKDIDTQLEAYEFLYSLAKTTGMRNRNATIHEIKIPACMQYPFGTKSYRVCALRHLTTTFYHQCGSCKMGPADSPDSVVDPQLRVKGIHKLRVVDASVKSKIPRGHTNVPVNMIAEKASDLIKATWISNSE